MKVNDFIKKLKEVEKNYKTLYVMGCFGAPLTEYGKSRYTRNHSFNRNKVRTGMIKKASEDTFGFDCVNLIKGILWGWNGDTTKKYGGATYCSNGVPDIGADTMISRFCSKVSKDFSTIKIGEAVWIPGHIGVYIGAGKVIECSPKFENRVQITNLGNIGYKTGNYRIWDKHGFINTIEYTVTKDETVSDVYKVKKGDTLSKIAKEFNTTVDKIVSDNKSKHKKISANYIVTGWTLKV